MNKRELFLNYIAQTSDAPLLLEIEKAKGIYLYDTNGKAYIDLISGIAVNNLGYNRKEIVKAVQEQAERYFHTMVYGEYILSPQVSFADLLLKQLPQHFNNVYFTNSGTEATEAAMKLAKRYTGRQQIIAATKAYHGSTQGAASLMSEPFYKTAFEPLLPHIDYIKFNNNDDINKITDKTACVILETIQGEWGVHLPKNDYLKKVAQKCKEVGALFILDECQVGFGRTGTLFAFEQYDVKPDVILLAKALGGGMPLGALVSNKKILNVFTHQPVLGHITTFGGHPVSCAAAKASLEVLLKENYIDEVEEKAALFKQLLIESPKVKEVRNAGLLMAVEIGSFEMVLSTIKKVINAGVITDWFLFNDTSIRIAPPLTINKDEIKKACSIIINALN